MSRRMFSGLSKDLGEPEVQRPWWKAMSGWGWLLLLFALFATFSFILGITTGETLFMPPVKSRSGHTWGTSFQDSPVLFLILMAANAAVVLLVWGLFIAWLRETPLRLSSASLPDASRPHTRPPET